MAFAMTMVMMTTAMMTTMTMMTMMTMIHMASTPLLQAHEAVHAGGCVESAWAAVVAACEASELLWALLTLVEQARKE